MVTILGMGLTFGNRLGAAMEAAGITKYRLAKLTEISQVQVGRLVAGTRDATPEAIAKIAPVLGLSIDEMQAWADEDLLGEERLGGLSEYVLGKRAKAEAYAKVFRVLQQQIKDMPEDTPDVARFALLQFSITVQQEVQALYEEVDREIRSQEGG